VEAEKLRFDEKARKVWHMAGWWVLCCRSVRLSRHTSHPDQATGLDGPFLDGLGLVGCPPRMPDLRHYDFALKVGARQATEARAAWVPPRGRRTGPRLP